MTDEARLERTEHGLVAPGPGWFVVNGRDARWLHRAVGGARTDFEGETEFEQLGVNLNVLEPGQPMTKYHWEADQEDFLVLAGEALLVVEGEERPLRAWDFVHCPPGTRHAIVGAGDGLSVVLAVGARDRTRGEEWGGYTVDEAALRHGAGVERETDDPAQAYAPNPRRQPVRYRDGSLPG